MQKGATGRAWAILAAGAAIQIFTGVPAAWGVFNQPVTQEYGLSEGAAGWVFSLLIAAFGVGCVIGGFLQDRHGPRCAALWGTGLLCGGMFGAAALPSEAGGWFWAVFSLPVGLGTAFLYPAIQSCAQKWFQDRKGLATGVIGGAVGLSGAFLTVFVRGTAAGIGPVQGIRGGVLGAGRSMSSGLSGGKPAAERPAPVREKAAGDRAGSWAGADAPHPKLLALCRCGVLFYPGGAAVQPHYIAAVCAAGACGRGCFVGGGAGQRGQRRRTAADADAQR